MAPGDRFGDLARQNGVKRREVNDRAMRPVDHGLDRDFDAVQVAVDIPRTTLGELVCGVQRNGPREGTVRPPGHRTIPIPMRISGVIVYCDVSPVGLTALGAVAVPGCFVGSFRYDAG